MSNLCYSAIDFKQTFNLLIGNDVWINRQTFFFKRIMMLISGKLQSHFNVFEISRRDPDGNMTDSITYERVKLEYSHEASSISSFADSSRIFLAHPKSPLNQKSSIFPFCFSLGKFGKGRFENEFSSSKITCKFKTTFKKHAKNSENAPTSKE